MNETMKKMNAEARAKITEAIASKEFVELITKTKSAADADSGSFKFIVSTSDVDRQGESVNQNGWDLTYYKMNPVVLWAHDYSSLPIGVCTSIEVKSGKLVAEGKFAPADANPFAQQVRKLYDLGMVNATSVGFIPKEFDQKADGVISKSELLEFSLVPVPANAHALRLSHTQIKDLGIDTAFMKTKGMEIAVKEDEVVPPAPAADPEVPAEIKPEAKGEVQAELNETEQREQKWDKYCEVMEAIDAFATVYFDETTAVEDFGKLMTELITLLQTVIANDGADDDAPEAKAYAAKLIAFIAGRKSFRAELLKNGTIMKSNLESLLRNSIALGSVTLSEGDKAAGDKSAIQRSNNSEGLKEFNDFVETRSLLRIADNALEKVLRKFNESARTRE